MNNRLSAMLVAVSSVSMLTACGGGSSSPVGDYGMPDPAPIAAPTVTLSVPATAMVDEGFTVGWAATDASGCIADFDGAHTGATESFTKIETVAGSRIYSVSCTGEGGSTTASATIEIYERPTAAGLWQGNTDTSRALGGVVRADGAYAFVYSSSSSPAAVDAANAAGFIAGSGTETISSITGGAFASADFREFNFEGDGAARGNSLSAGFTNKALFGLALSGDGAGTFLTTPLAALPTTLTSGATDADLPLPGVAVMDVAGAVSITSNFVPGSGTANGRAFIKNGGTLAFTAIGRVTTTVTDQNLTQNYALSGQSAGTVFSAASGVSEALDCVDLPGAPTPGCGYVPPGMDTTFAAVTGSVNTATGGSITTSFEPVPGVTTNTTVFTFTPRAPSYPSAPTFTDGGTPWTISYSGTLALSGTLAFAPYTANIDLLNGVTATLSINQRQLVVNTTAATPVYDSGAQRLTLTGATFSDVSGVIGCANTGTPSLNGIPLSPVCTSPTIASTSTQRTGDVEVDIDQPAAGQYQARIYLGGKSNPDSVLSFAGNLSSAPITTTHFTTAYSSAFETVPTLAAIAGSYTGSAGVETAIQSGASFVIDASGNLTGGVEASGCTFSGTLTPAATGNVYDVALTFISGGGCTYAGAFTGTAFSDASGKLNMTAVNGARDKGFLFIQN